MSKKYRVLFLGASYGSLLATRMVMAGHDATMVCLPNEVEAFNAHGAIVRFPVRGRDELIEVNSDELRGTLDAIPPQDTDPSRFDLVCLAMQEPQYRSDEIRALLSSIGEAGRPCMSIMNMPPLAYLRRLESIDPKSVERCFTDPSVWDPIDPKLITLCSPDPQAFRPPEETANVLQVTLPTNFKAARFDSDADTAMLNQIQSDIELCRYRVGDDEVALPVKLKVHESLFVPLAKWAMLLTGNYRCIGDGPVRSISDAVHSDVSASKDVYTWVVNICELLGADPEDLVPFEKYANAAIGLLKPSSAARALYAGAPYIERVDCLVETLGKYFGQESREVARTVAIVDRRLRDNRIATNSGAARG